MNNIIVKKTKNKNVGFLIFKKKKILCYVGKNGIGNKKREGDLITPRGIFRMRKVFYRYDKLGDIKSKMPKQRIEKKYTWITDSRNKYYNKFSVKKLRCFDENMYREDSLYDLVITLDFNINPVRKFKGSAIFIHCSEKGRKFTEGCIAVNKKDLIDIVSLISPFSFLKIY